MPFGFRLALLVAVSSLSLPPTVAQANKQKAREFYRKGMAEYVLEHWDASIREFEAGFREEQEAAFLFNIAQAHRKARRFDQSIQYFKKYLDFAPEAKDRPQVEKDIADEQAEMAAAEKAPPPVVSAGGAGDGGVAAVEPVKPDTVSRGILPEVKASPIAAVALPAAPVVAPESKRRRWPIWAAVGGAALVVVGVGIGVAVAATVRNDASIPSSTLGTVTFP